MKKIHARLSVEIEVSDEEFDKIVEEAKIPCGYTDVPLDMFPELIDRAKPCDWDEQGYIPNDWLIWDINGEVDEA